MTAFELTCLFKNCLHRSVLRSNSRPFFIVCKTLSLICCASWAEDSIIIYRILVQVTNNLICGFKFIGGPNYRNQSKKAGSIQCPSALDKLKKLGRVIILLYFYLSFLFLFCW